MSGAARGISALRAVLRASRAEILDSWTQRIAALPDFASTPAAEIRGNTERCLEAFEAALAVDEDPSTRDVEASLQAFADSLASRRFETDFAARAPMLAASQFRAAVLERPESRRFGVLDGELVVAICELTEAFHRAFATSFSRVWVQALEARFQRAFDDAGDAIVCFDGDGQVVWCSRRIEDLTGRAKAAWQGRSWLELVDPEDRASALACQERVFAARGTGEGATGAAYRAAEPGAESASVSVLTAKGERRRVELHVHPVRGSTRPIALGVVRDVTAQEHDRAQLLQSDRMASLGRIAASIAHELNNPLAWVATNVDLVRRRIRQLGGNLEVDLGPMLDDALVGSRRMGGIVADLRTYAPTHADDYGAYDLSEVIELSLRMSGARPGAGLRIARAYGPIRAYGRAGRLSQLFVNLFSNAVQAMQAAPDRDHELRISAHMEGDRVYVEVADTGAGIPAAIRDRLFEPFVSGRGADGMGLGLWVARGVAEEHGGSLTIVESSAEGTRFRVEVLRGRPALREETAAPAGVGLGTQHTLLFVDDEPMILRVYERRFRSRCRVLLAADGSEALDIVVRSGDTISGIVCDVVMPRMTGFDLFAELERSHPALARKVVFVSGAVDVGRLAGDEVLGRVPVLAKPIEFEELDRAVAALLSA